MKQTDKNWQEDLVTNILQKIENEVEGLTVNPDIRQADWDYSRNTTIQEVLEIIQRYIGEK